MCYELKNIILTHKLSFIVFFCLILCLIVYVYAGIEADNRKAVQKQILFYLYKEFIFDSFDSFHDCANENRNVDSGNENVSGLDGDGYWNPHYACLSLIYHCLCLI